MLQMTYYVVCPDIDPLTTAAADFFQQLGTGEYLRRSHIHALFICMNGCTCGV